MVIDCSSTGFWATAPAPPQAATTIPTTTIADDARNEMRLSMVLSLRLEMRPYPVEWPDIGAHVKCVPWELFGARVVELLVLNACRGRSTWTGTWCDAAAETSPWGNTNLENVDLQQGKRRIKGH
jgi:hypothetical protein